MSTPSPLLGGSVLFSEGCAPAGLALRLPREREGERRSRETLAMKNAPSWEGGGGGHTPTL
jgi:hypothetical protein